MGVMSGPPDSDKLPMSIVSNDVPMSADRSDKLVTEHAAYQGDLLTRRKAWVSGALKNDSFIYASKAAVAGGAGKATFYITSDGTSTGTAVFNNIYADSITATALGSGGNYQVANPVVAANKKSITVDVSQITTVLGLLTYNATAADGVDCRLYVMGD